MNVFLQRGKKRRNKKRIRTHLHHLESNVSDIWRLLDLNQNKAIQLTQTSFSMEMIKELLRWNSNSRHTAYEADALPTELPRQLSWLG